MKTLNQYTDEKLSKIYRTYGAFFAFGTQQFNDSKKEGVVYVSLNSGLICPKENAPKLLTEVKQLFIDAEKEYLKDNGLENIIKYELSNHECYYTGDWVEAFYITECYGATKDMVYNIYCENLAYNHQY